MCALSYILIIAFQLTLLRNDQFLERIIKLIPSPHNITFHHMKPYQNLTKKAQADLQKILDRDTLAALKSRLVKQSQKGTHSSKMYAHDNADIGTPSTVDTTLRRRGNAIAKSVRPESRSKGKVRPGILSRPSLNSQNAVTRAFLSHENQESMQTTTRNQQTVSTSNLTRKVLLDRAVYYGNVELPYLHSSDAISCLYQKSKNSQKNAQPLINPPSNISPYLLTNLKNLYLYYTPLDSLRQLGTGWSNLKSLTIMCSPELADLSGLSIFPSLEFLFAPHNNIRQISDIMYHSTLRCLDLQDNKIDLIDQVQYIYTITHLEWVDLSHNPIMNVKEKFRIICENLGTKMQVEEFTRGFEYQMAEKQLDYEVFSYEGIGVSNDLIRDINEQIIKQEIKVGQLWRAARQKIKNQALEGPTAADIEIIEGFAHDSDEQESFQESMRDRTDNKLKLRVTPLIQYVEPVVNVGPLKKYFNNKVCPQANKPEKQREQRQAKPQNQQALEKQTPYEGRIRKFAATQKLSSAVSEQKKRLTSISVKKKLGKLSLSKNMNLASTASSVLTSLKTKQEFNDLNCMTLPSNLKFGNKRRLISKLSEEKAL